MKYRDQGFDRYGDAFMFAPGLLEPPDRRGRGRARSERASRRRRQMMEEDELEIAQYRQLQENAIRVPPSMDEDDMFGGMASRSPFFEEDLFSPPGRSREEAMLGMVSSAPNELDLMRSATSGHERMPDMGVLDGIFGGFDPQPYDMSIMDRDFALFGPPVSGMGGESLFADAYPSIERGPPDPMAAYYGEPQLNPRRRRSRSIT
jgi:hypothetical protein